MFQLSSSANGTSSYVVKTRGTPNVVLPNFFDAIAHPDVVLPLILSHLLSESLWERRGKVIENMPNLTVPDPSIPVELFAIKRFIDKNFEHLHPQDVAKIYGYIDVAHEKGRFGDDVIDQGIAGLARYVEFIQSTGTDRISWMLDALADGTFPNYTYSTYDVIRAHRTYSQNRKSSSNGIVSCLDEMSLFCAAALTLPKEMLYHTIMLVGPTHYTVLFWDRERNGYWFPAKRYLFSRATWKVYVEEQHAGDIQTAFDSIMCETNRIISIRGAFDFDTGVSQIPESILRDTVDDIEQLFGFVPPHLSAAMERPIVEIPSSPYHEVYLTMLGASSRDEVFNAIHTAATERSERWAEDVLLAYRSVHVPNPERYFEAALESPLARAAAATMRTVDDAVAYVDAIPGRTSIFEEPDRIARPDEVRRRQTGPGRDRELLLRVRRHGGGV